MRTLLHRPRFRVMSYSLRKHSPYGDNLSFWIREGKFGVFPTLTDQPMTIIKPETMTAPKEAFQISGK